MTIPDLDGIEVTISPQQYEHARDDEYSLLGACLRGGRDTYEQAREIVQPDAFFCHPFGWAWEAMETLYKNEMGIDVFTVYDELVRAGRIGEFVIGGTSGRALLSQIRGDGDPRNVMSYAENVQDLAAKRELDGFFAKCIYWSKNGRRAKDIMQDVEKEFSKIVLYGASDEYTVPISVAIQEAYEWTDAAAQGKIKGVKTGYVDLDKLLGSMIAGNVYTVAARPKKGKTGFLLSIARNAAKSGKRVAMFSLEMSRLQVGQRLIAQEGEIDLHNIISGQMFEEDWPKFTNAGEVVNSWPIIINDLSSINISQVRQTARKIQASGGLDLLIVDYIQLAGSDGNYKTREQEVSAIMRGLKYLARELNVPILAAAQLNRAIEARSDRRPILSDLRESGSIEQDSYCVMFIHDSEDEKKVNIKELIVAAHRNGPVGTVELVFRAAYVKFENAYQPKY